MTIKEAEAIVAKELGRTPDDVECRHLFYDERCLLCYADMRKGEPGFLVGVIGPICGDRLACRKRQLAGKAAAQARFEEEVISGKIRFAKGDA